MIIIIIIFHFKVVLISSLHFLILYPAIALEEHLYLTFYFFCRDQPRGLVVRVSAY